MTSWNAFFDWLATKDELVAGPVSLPFRLRDDLLSLAELSFYQVLSGVAGERVTICAKVNLADLFFVATGDHRKIRAIANRIDRKHVDFLLCNPETMRPLAGIELDDKSHNRMHRKTRDELVGEVFNRGGIGALITKRRPGRRRKVKLERVRDLLVPVLENPAQAGQVHWTGVKLHGYAYQWSGD